MPTRPPQTPCGQSRRGRIAEGKNSLRPRLSQTQLVQDEIGKNQFPDMLVEAVASTKEVIGNTEKETPTATEQLPAAHTHLVIPAKDRIHIGDEGVQTPVNLRYGSVVPWA
jgi:hypothetical protein